MTIQNGEYIKQTEDDITDALHSELQAEFGENIDLTESSVFTTLSQVIAAVLNSNQEESIEDVYQSAFLETATGIDLDRVVALLGLQRRPAINATGVERFIADGKVTQDYVIQRGVTVQTESTPPSRYNTTTVTSLELVSDFESGSLQNWSGDTGNATVVQRDAYRGDYSVELGATSGAHIYQGNVTFQQGTTTHAHVRPDGSSTVPIVTFGVQADDPTDYYQVAFDVGGDQIRLERVVDGSVDSTLDTAAQTLSAQTYYEVEIDWNITDNIGLSIKDANENELTTLGAVDDTYQSGYMGIKSGDATAAKQFDWLTSSATSATIRAVEGGPDGNVGAESVTVAAEAVAGVSEVTNLYPIGDSDFTDLSGNSFRTGRAEESDEDLRERAEDITTGGGAATHDAIVSALVNDIPDVSSVTLFENKTDQDNTGTGGLPPHSFEAVVFGGSDQEVAEILFEEKAVTSRDYSGVNGTSASATVTADSNGQQRTIEFSRPTEIQVDLTLDVVINDNYIGDDDVRNRIVNYIGGIDTNEVDQRGLGVGEDVIIDVVRDIVVGADDTGVVAFDQNVDGTPVETTPSTTTSNGINVIDIGATEVAQTDATDGSITLNTRQI